MELWTMELILLINYLLIVTVFLSFLFMFMFSFGMLFYMTLILISYIVT